MTKSLEEITRNLERKYIVFAYRESDCETEACGISIYRMKESKLEKIFNPGDSYDPGKYNACCYDEKMKRYLTVNEIALRKLNECNIKEVYSVFSTKDFFGIPREDFCTINPESGCEEGCENWGWFTYIRFESDLVYFLVNNGIKVEDYDTN